MHRRLTTSCSGRSAARPRKRRRRSTSSTPQFAHSPDGIPIAYQVQGHGRRALVLVHGWCCDRTYWSSQLPCLSERYRVVLLDLAGHGESGTGRKDWTIAAFGGDVQAVVEALSLHEMILVGHSMGADVVLQSSLALGSRVRGLIWVDQYTQLDRLPDEATVRQRLERFHADFQGTMQALVRRLFGVGASPAMVERVTQHMSSVSPSVALPALEATWNHGRSVSKVLSQVRIPIVAINARSAPGDRESLQRRGINVIEVAETGHFPMLEQPERFAACLLQAANSLCGTQKAAIR